MALQGLFSGPFKQFVEWMEWSSMHGLGAVPHVYLCRHWCGCWRPSDTLFGCEQGSFPVFSQRQPCSSGAHIAKWLVKRVDVDKYMVFKEKIMYFDHQDHIVKEQGVSGDKVASLEVRRVRFSWARPETFTISFDHRLRTIDAACRSKSQRLTTPTEPRSTGSHVSKIPFKIIKVDSRLAVIHH